MPWLIRPERFEDREEIWKLHQETFAGTQEADLVDDLRHAALVTASLVAESDRRIVGHILFSRIKVVTEEGEFQVHSLAPMAVHKEFQRQGIGSELVQAGLKACRKKKVKAIFVLGHPEFYSKFGFTPRIAQPFESPFGGGEAWMGLELEPHYLINLKGKAEFSEPFLKLS